MAQTLARRVRDWARRVASGRGREAPRQAARWARFIRLRATASVTRPQKPKAPSPASLTSQPRDLTATHIRSFDAPPGDNAGISELQDSAEVANGLRDPLFILDESEPHVALSAWAESVPRRCCHLRFGHKELGEPK